MVKWTVCRTLVAHPERPVFLLVTRDQIREFPSLIELAHHVKEYTAGTLWLKNEVPGDLSFIQDKAGIQVREIVRLTVEEVRMLKQLLRT